MNTDKLRHHNPYQWQPRRVEPGAIVSDEQAEQLLADATPLVRPDELRGRAWALRTLCALCIGTWAVPITLLALVSRCGT